MKASSASLYSLRIRVDRQGRQIVCWCVCQHVGCVGAWVGGHQGVSGWVTARYSMVVWHSSGSSSSSSSWWPSLDLFHAPSLQAFSAWPLNIIPRSPEHPKRNRSPGAETQGHHRNPRSTNPGHQIIPKTEQRRRGRCCCACSPVGSKALAHRTPCVCDQHADG